VQQQFGGSPLRDAGDPATCLATDEVGQARPIGPVCDIGAYEFTDFNVVTLTINPNVTISKVGPTFVSGTVTCSHFDIKPQTLRVDLAQDQKVGRTPTTVQATADVSFTCDKTKWPWGVNLTPSSGAFAAGAAVASVRTVNTPVWYKPSATSSAVKVVVAHR